ncbi:PadR family transcriptional regulator [Psychromarinibacter sp. C21-152]|uniref:PadR family transcriptional regulator n=1 Tax=Psychromarinibacter sediminicola TaxID=3033385 RepID=A0AAE3NXV2_9RHOB|nr:PadR family transcriptional regulator [Psychromarinibacter sediminicola]MDF0603976.1 PadR family transcriptional regulator [Psychromarinibacter sediminicola]
MTATTIRVLIGFLESREPLSGADLINQYGLFSGTLYPILRRLEKAGWVEATWEDGDPKQLGRPLRRLYDLTAAGQREAENALKNERTRKFFGSVGKEPLGAT